MNQKHADVHTSKVGALLLIIGVILIAANLRTSITGVGPLIDVIKASTGMSNALAGMLTTIPLIAFALFSPLAPWFARKLGIETTLAAGLLVITIGILIRCLHSSAWLFVGMLLAGIGITMGNVLLPGLIKRDFSENVGIMTGIYSVAMNVFAALASGISVPLSKVGGWGWQGSLMSWGILSLLAFIVWLPQLKKKHFPKQQQRPKVSLWRSGLAWSVTLFMGLQSLLFYSNVAWLSELLQGYGLSATSAGWMLSLMQFVSLPASFIVPILAGRFSSQRGLIVLISAMFFVGFLGLILIGSLATWLWVVLIGIAGGAAISLALTLFGLRTKHADDAANLSGMAQSLGYLLAAIGPFLFGLLHDLTHGWTSPLVLLLVMTVLLLIFGLKAGSPQFIQAKSQQKEEVH
ncbi:putative transporter YycB [Pullulanibacillus camelliae]|uniref:Putative transporter YycB n=1 Tax=Pullulanibacillus camelliae TaxID=1707096 RepID=A0A8J2VMM3_9BACL|nr:MFS transporter [Pullulanibacillus camelliae]GGE33649.1 putative transporter YycB [Pullulanibacillus camelliae]